MDAPTRLVVMILLGIAMATYAMTSDAMPLAVKIVACESRGKVGLCNKKADKYGRACGIAMFKPVTFRTFKRESRNPLLRYNNQYDQLLLLNWALRHGKGNHWACYRKIRRGTWKITPRQDRMMRGNKYITTIYGGSI